MKDLKIDSEFKNIIPPLSENELNGLSELVVKDGCRDPIVIWNETIIDGHNRYGICKRKNIPFNTVDYSDRLSTRDEVIDWMYSNQLGKRNLTDEQKSYLRGSQYTHRKKMWGGSRGNQYTKVAREHFVPLADAKTADKIAEEQGVSHMTVKRDAAYADAVDKVAAATGLTPTQITSGSIKAAKKDIVELAKKPDTVQLDVIATVKTEPKKDIKTVLKEVSRKEKREELIQKGEEVQKTPDTITLYCKDFLAEYKNNISANSVDCIITDPPYVKDWVDNYEHFAIAAEYVLKPGGFVVSYIGHFYLDKFVEALSKHLGYYWIICIKHAGQTVAVHSRSVQCGMKPIVVFFKPPMTKTKRYFKDIIEGSGMEKEGHDWQQGEEELRQIFEPFTNPGDTILDPFMGSGTVIAMAKKMGRKAIGFDIVEDNVKIVKGRVS